MGGGIECFGYRFLLNRCAFLATFIPQSWAAPQRATRFSFCRLPSPAPPAGGTPPVGKPVAAEERPKSAFDSRCAARGPGGFRPSLACESWSVTADRGCRLPGCRGAERRDRSRPALRTPAQRTANSSRGRCVRTCGNSSGDCYCFPASFALSKLDGGFGSRRRSIGFVETSILVLTTRHFPQRRWCCERRIYRFTRTR